MCAVSVWWQLSFSRRPLHEYLNAITMIIPNLVSVWYVMHYTDDVTGKLTPVPAPMVYVMIGTALHMVFSVAFHVDSAMHLEEGLWNEDLKLWIMPSGRHWHPTAHNKYRRLDQTFIHVTGVLYTIAYRPTVPFTLISICWNTYSIFYIWKCDPEREEPPFVFESQLKAEGPRRRVLHMAVAAFIYLSALASGGHEWAALKCLGALALAMGLFSLQPIVGGYGHSLFHLALVIFYKYGLDAAIAVDGDLHS